MHDIKRKYTIDKINTADVTKIKWHNYLNSYPL